MRGSATPMSPLEAFETLAPFVRSRGEGALRLAMHAAVPEGFRADMVPLLRRNFVPEAGGIAADADVMFAPFCEHLGGEYFRFDPEARRLLLDHLAMEYAEERRSRIQSVAAFLLCYIERLMQEAHAGQDRMLLDYLEMQRWVALAFLDPAEAAGQLASVLETSERQRSAVAQVRVGSVAAVLALPLAGHRALIDYALGVQALAEGNFRNAENLLGPLGDASLKVGAVSLRSPAELLAEGGPATPTSDSARVSIQETDEIGEKSVEPTPFYDDFIDKSGRGPDMIWLPGGPERKKAYKAYEVFQDRSDSPAMVYLPGGTFKMGDIQGIGDDHERPVHDVTLDAFAIGRYPVTVGEFRRFVEDTGYRTEAEREDGAWVFDGKEWNKKPDANWINPYLEQGNDHPVVCISWNDAAAYCGWLSEQTGERYSLPSEAEWEYACRASSETVYCFGDDEQRLGEYAWYAKNAGGKTHPVGEKLPNDWQLFDMHGNVWEWVRDWYGRYSSEPQNNPSGPESGSDRVFRGGSWSLVANICRSACRNNWPSGHRTHNLGFRLARRV